MQVKHLHIEASSFCNAKCPGCPRNAYGYSIKGLYKEQNLDFDKFIDLFIHILINSDFDIDDLFSTST